jgi:hypothetical protein
MAPLAARDVDRRREPGFVRTLTSAWRPLPDFLVIGAQRSGTTSLYRYLGRHPQIEWARIKEVHYFDRAFARGTGWYRAQFRLSLGRRTWLAGDASPYYMVHPLVPARAAALVPQARLIATLRNPVDRAYSHYQHVVARGHTDLSFEDALDLERQIAAGELRRLAAEPTYRSRLHEWHSYVGRGQYAEQLERWLEHFPRDRLHVVVSEQLFADPNAILAGVAEFLGVPPHVVASPEQLVKRGTYPSPMSSATRQRLVEHFRPHNRRLEELLGLDVGWDR